MAEQKSTVKDGLLRSQARLPRSKYRQVGSDEPLWIIIDPGNTDVKAMVHARWGEEKAFPHSVRKVAGEDYRTLALSYKNQMANFDGTAIFEIKGLGGFVVGRHAEQAGSGIRLIGVDKYRRDHLGALLIAALIQLYPAGHSDVHLVITHPAKITTDNMKDLWKSVKGRFEIRIADGREVAYNITEVIPYEEPVASFQTFALTTEGKAYKRERIELQPGKEFLIVDIGGGISHMVPGVVNSRGALEININAAGVIEAGIQDVVEAFKSEIQARYPEYFKNSPPTDQQIYEALMTDHIYPKGVDLECEIQVNNAMQALRTPLEKVYVSRQFRSGNPFYAIVVAGGGGGVAFHYLCERLFNHPSVISAEDELDRMRFGGIRGASKGLVTFLGTVQMENR